MGSPDPRFGVNGQVDFRLQRMLKAYSKQDPPPNRVKPVPVQVLRRIMLIAHSSNDPFQAAVADMICLAFFFLLRPGEYVDSPSDSVPFKFTNVQLFRAPQRLNLRTATEGELLTATFSSLTFDNQKHTVLRGEVIGLSPSGDRLLCPRAAIARRILHLRQHNAPDDAPLWRVYTAPGRVTSVKPTVITDTLRAGCCPLSRP